jgi:excisionase family DNA binding protein
MREQTYLKTKREAARYLNVSVGSLERLMRCGLVHVRCGKHLVRFRPEDLADFVERRRVQQFGQESPEAQQALRETVQVAGDLLGLSAGGPAAAESGRILVEVAK